MNKSIASDGSIVLDGGDGTFVFRRLKHGALLVSISGNDHGQFGSAALDEIRQELLRVGKLELLVDAERAELVTVEVSQEWSRFFSDTRHQLTRVSVLTGSKLVNLAVAIAQHLSQTGNLIQIYSDRELFQAALARASTSALARNAAS